jgi:hypothetical protein
MNGENEGEASWKRMAGRAKVIGKSFFKNRGKSEFASNFGGIPASWESANKSYWRIAY